MNRRLRIITAWLLLVVPRGADGWQRPVPDVQYDPVGTAQGEVDAHETAFDHAEIEHANRGSLDKVGESAGAPTWNGGEWPGGGQSGTGDMLRSVYDIDLDGVADWSEEAVAVPWSGVTGKPPDFPPSSHAHAGTYEPAAASIQTHISAPHAPATAEQNVQADWNATSGDAYILNKPTIPTATSQLTNNSGFLTNLATPGPIGTGTPSTGTFTDLTVAGGGIHVVGPAPVDGQWGQWVFASDSGAYWVLFRPETDFTANYTITLPLASGSVAIEVAAPATAASPCKAGTIAHATGYVYVCVATNTWQRAALSTW
jgi:hypothetical protein